MMAQGMKDSILLEKSKVMDSIGIKTVNCTKVDG